MRPRLARTLAVLALLVGLAWAPAAVRTDGRASASLPISPATAARPLAASLTTSTASANDGRRSAAVAKSAERPSTSSRRPLAASTSQRAVAPLLRRMLPGTPGPEWLGVRVHALPSSVATNRRASVGNTAAPINRASRTHSATALQTEKAFANLATSKKKPGKEHDTEVAEGIELQQAILKALKTLDPAKLHKNRPEFLSVLNAALRQQKLKPPAPVLKAILSALSERDEAADICTDVKGNPEADPELRDTENVPLSEDIQEFFAREVEPHVPDAWINTTVRDPQDGKIGRVGYEINFNRYFYKYQPPRPLEEIEADIRTLEREIVGMLREVAG